MLTKAKQSKLLDALKKYSKQYLHGKLTDLDESGTRLMINSFLTEVLGFLPIEEVKTEYMIRGTYADYVIQQKGTRHFLVEVKSFSLALSDKHLRQAINYGANEGIEWAMLTNGKVFEFYKILFNKPIESVKVFSFDFSDTTTLKEHIETLQYLHKDSVFNKGLDFLWNKCLALDSKNVAALLYNPTVINFIRKALKTKFKTKFSEDEVANALNKILIHQINPDDIKIGKIKREKKGREKAASEKPVAHAQAETEGPAESSSTEPILN